MIYIVSCVCIIIWILSRCICIMHGSWNKQKWLLIYLMIFLNLQIIYFIFCGSLNLYQPCDHYDTNHFDFHSFIFTSSYLMINYFFLVLLLNTAGTVSYKENDTLLPSLYSLLTLNFNLPWITEWFQSKFSNYNKSFVDSIMHLPYSIFRQCLLKFERHN